MTYPTRKEMIENLTTAGYTVNTKTATKTLEKRWDVAVKKGLVTTSTLYKGVSPESRVKRIKENRKHLRALRRRRGW